ncbi:MAG: hypothetical protein ACI9QD_001261 [Thermoproteota archaeon]|jgi:uncharacterized protein (DUF58 family)
MDIKEIEKIVGRIQQQLFRKSNSFSAGILKSNVRGSGLQFKEHQVYNYGDDVRFIDWKLSAKSGQTYVKTFEEDRNSEIITVIDLSPSMFIGFNKKSKLKCILEIVCLLYLLVRETNDQQKFIIVGKGEISLPPKQGKEGIIQLITILERIDLLDEKGNVNFDFEFKEEVNDKKDLAIIKSYVAKRKEVIFFSDFNNFNDYKEVDKLVNHKNFHCFKIISPLEENSEMPFAINAFQIKKGLKQKIFARAKSKEEEKITISPKIKTLNIKDRYLENFVKEMI